MAELGWAGILVSEEYGGFDFGMMGMGGILEETGKKTMTFLNSISAQFLESTIRKKCADHR